MFKIIDMHGVVIVETSKVLSDSFVYNGVVIQRMVRDDLWYAVYSNKILNWSRSRDKLIEWVDDNVISM